MRYKVGDKVVIRDDLKLYTSYGWLDFNSDMDKFRGKTEQIKRFNANGFYSLEGDYGLWLFNDEMIDHEATAKLNEVKPVDLLETGMVIELRNGNRYLVLKGDFEVGGYGRQNMSFVSPTGFINIVHYDEYLKYKGEYSSGYDVFKVYRSSIFGLSAMLELNQDCELVWKRNPEPKQPKVITYTTQELMEKLGLDGDTKIEIVDRK